MPSDPAEALKWALNHSGDAWWVVGVIAAGIAWTSKRLRDWNRRNALVTGPPKPKPAAVRWTPGTASPPPPAAAQPAPASAYSAAASYAAAAYAAQPAYAAPPPGAASHGGPARKLHREAPPAQRTAAPAQRAVTPVARSVDVPVATGAWTLRGAFGDPAHARTAVVIAEVLGPPVGLR